MGHGGRGGNRGRLNIDIYDRDNDNINANMYIIDMVEGVREEIYRAMANIRDNINNSILMSRYSMILHYI